MKAQLILETLHDKMSADLRRSIDALRGVMTVLPALEKCEKCGERRYITHRVMSDELDLRVCVICGLDAEQLEAATRGCCEGKITVRKL